MAETVKCSIHKDLLKNAYMNGMRLNEASEIVMDASTGVRSLYMMSIDGKAAGARWGRFSLDKKLDENMVFVVRCFASDEKVITVLNKQIDMDDFLASDKYNNAQKRDTFDRKKAIKVINSESILLDSLSGRYLWLYIEVLGEGNGVINNIHIGDENDVSQSDSEHEQEAFDIDKASAEMLVSIGEWFGIELDAELFEEETLRKIIKKAYYLNKYKGTKHCIETLANIVLDRDVEIVENIQITDEKYKDENFRKLYTELYGDSNYDVTLLISGNEKENETARLTYLFEQFKPVRIRMNLVYLGESDVMDGHTYLDDNATLYVDDNAEMDGVQVFDGSAVLM